MVLYGLIEIRCKVVVLSPKSPLSSGPLVWILELSMATTLLLNGLPQETGMVGQALATP